MSKNDTPLRKFIPFAVILIVAIIQSIVGIFQYFDLLKSSDSFFSVIGTFYSPNALALYLSVAFMICVWRLNTFKNKKKWVRLMYLALLLLFGVFIIGLKARSSWYAMVFGLMTLGILDLHKFQFLKTTSKRKLSAIGLSLIVFFSISSYYGYLLKKDSANSRLFIAKTALNKTMEKPVFGHGIFSFKGKYNLAKSHYFNQDSRDWSEVKNGGYTYHAFNEWVYLIFEIGIVGLLLFLFILVLLFKGFQITDHSKIGLTILVMLFVFSMVSYPIYIPHIAFLGIFAAAIMRNEGDYKAITFRHKQFSKIIRLATFLIAIVLFYISISKIQARIEMIAFYNSPDHKEYNNKQKLISFYENIDDFGESDYYLGDQLYKLGYKDEGLSNMRIGFYTLLEPRMGEQLAAYLAQESKYDEAEKIHKINMSNEPFRFKPKMDYVWFLGSQGRYSEQNEVLKRIINLPVKIPSKEVENYKRQARQILDGNKDLR